MSSMKLPFLSIIFLYLLDISTGAPGPRIIGGQIAPAGEQPYMAAVYISRTSQTFFCGGSLINDQHILTTGTCVSGTPLFTIRLGLDALDSNSANVIRASSNRYITHPNFYPGVLDYEVGLVVLNLPISFTDWANPINLPTTDVTVGAAVKTLGWGQTTETTEGMVNNLRQVTLTVISNEECQRFFNANIVPTMLCAVGSFNEGICVGDSGGPLVLTISGQPIIVGISSFVSKDGCESPEPSGFAKVFPFVDWIKDRTGII